VSTVVIHLRGTHVESYGSERLAERDRQRQADIPESNYSNRAHISPYSLRLPFSPKSNPVGRPHAKTMIPLSN
jgi:hypothetical protein